jgi:hypothetical protein
VSEKTADIYVVPEDGIRVAAVAGTDIAAVLLVCTLLTREKPGRFRKKDFHVYALAVAIAICRSTLFKQGPPL